MAAVLAAFALRLAELGRQNIWWDEARNIDVSLRALVDIAPAYELDIQPPFYFWLLHGWLGLLGVARGTPPELLAWAARAMSVTAGVAGVALVAALASRIGRDMAAVSAALIAAFSPFWLAESQESRMYTVMLALLAAAAWYLLSGLEPGIDRSARIRRLAAFTILSAAALITHYNVVFVLVPWYLWWAVVALRRPGRWRNLGAPLVTGLATVVLFLPLLPVALRQIPGYANPNLTVPGVVTYLLQNFEGHVGGYAYEAAALGGYANIWLIASLVLAAGGLVALIVRHRRAQGGATAPAFATEITFLIVWLVGGLFFYYIGILRVGAFNIRYSSIVTPALIALLGAGIAGWGRWLAVPVLALLLAGFQPLLRADLFDDRFAREDIAGVTKWLRENTHEGDVIFVDQKYPFPFYYQRFTTRPDEDPSGPEPAPARYLFVDANDLDQKLNQWAGNARRVFWVQWFESDTDPRHLVPFLLDEDGHHGGEENYRGYSINWWEMNPPNTFALASAMRPVQVSFPPAVQTVEASLPVTAEVGADIGVVIRWQRIRDGVVDKPLKARVALYDESGNRVAQSDERLLNDRHVGPAEWSMDDQPLNAYLIQPDPALPSGDYDIRLLVYNADTLEPMGVVDAAGAEQGVEVSLGSLKIE